MNMRLQIVSIQSCNELLLWREPLKKLFSKLQCETFCTDPDWLICWIKHYLDKNDRIAITLHLYDGELVAAYPLYQKRILFGYELRFIGTGEPEKAEVCSEFQDFMILPEHRLNSLMLFNLQTNRQNGIFQISLDVVQDGAICQQWIQQISSIWRKKIKPNGRRYLLPIESDEHEQIRRFSHQSSRRHAKKFLQLSDVVIEHCSKPKELLSYFRDLIHLHNQHWHKQGKDGAFATEQFRAFHLEYAQNALSENKLLMFRLSVKQQLIAVFYGFYSHDRLYYYQSGISRYSAVPSAGIAMHLVAIRFARSRGIGYYDLMKGTDDSYKARLVDPTLRLKNITAHHGLFSWMKMLRKLVN